MPKPTQEKQEAFERFCLVLSQVPQGKVCSYGYLAKLAEIGHARQACQYLRKVPRGSNLPWFRIVNAQGKLADFGNADKQRKLLQADGIVFGKNGRIPKECFIDIK